MVLYRGVVLFYKPVNDFKALLKAPVIPVGVSRDK